MKILRKTTTSSAEEIKQKIVSVKTYVPTAKPFTNTYEMTIGALKEFTDDLSLCAEFIISVK